MASSAVEGNPISVKCACSYARLPTLLLKRGGIVNIYNKDERCFGYSLVAAMMKGQRKNDAWDSKHYQELGAYGLDKLQYPVKIADLPQIEKKLQVGFNVISFYDEAGRAKFPIYISEDHYTQRIDLLFWNGHFAWIKDISRVMTDLTTHRCKKWICSKCLDYFYLKSRMIRHSKKCDGFGPESEEELPKLKSIMESVQFELKDIPNGKVPENFSQCYFWNKLKSLLLVDSQAVLSLVHDHPTLSNDGHGPDCYERQLVRLKRKAEGIRFRHLLFLLILNFDSISFSSFTIFYS